MSTKPPLAPRGSEPTVECVAQLLGVVAEHDVDLVLSDMEQRIGRLRADAEEVAAARKVLSNTPAAVLREALRVRAAEAAQ